MGIKITYQEYNNGYKPLYNAHKNVGVYYTQQNMVIILILYNCDF